MPLICFLNSVCGVEASAEEDAGPKGVIKQASSQSALADLFLLFLERLRKDGQNLKEAKYAYRFWFKERKLK